MKCPINTFARRFSNLMLWNCIIFTIFSTFCRSTLDSSIIYYEIPLASVLGTISKNKNNWNWVDVFYLMKFYSCTEKVGRRTLNQFLRFPYNLINMVFSSMKMNWPCLVARYKPIIEYGHVICNIWYVAYYIPYCILPYHMVHMVPYGTVLYTVSS